MVDEQWRRYASPWLSEVQMTDGNQDAIQSDMWFSIELIIVWIEWSLKSSKQTFIWLKVERYSLWSLHDMLPILLIQNIIYSTIIYWIVKIKIFEWKFSNNFNYLKQKINTWLEENLFESNNLKPNKCKF